MIYFFRLDDEKFYVDWKNGSGSVGIGEPPMDKKPDVSFTLRKEWLIKVLNRKNTFKLMLSKVIDYRLSLIYKCLISL